MTKDEAKANVQSAIDLLNSVLEVDPPPEPPIKNDSTDTSNMSSVEPPPDPPKVDGSTWKKLLESIHREANSYINSSAKFD